MNRGDNEGVTALHIAAREGHIDVTEYLISQGAEVNMGDDERLDCITQCCLLMAILM